MNAWEEEERQNLTTCETLIMKVIWDHEADLTIQELLEAINDQYEKDYKRTTVVNFLVRLTAKGFVKNYHKGRQAFVHPLISEEDYKSDLIKEQTDFWFKGEASDLLASLCRVQKLSKEENEKIRRLLDELD